MGFVTDSDGESWKSTTTHTISCLRSLQRREDDKKFVAEKCNGEERVGVVLLDVTC